MVSQWCMYGQSLHLSRSKEPFISFNPGGRHPLCGEGNPNPRPPGCCGSRTLHGSCPPPTTAGTAGCLLLCPPPHHLRAVWMLWWTRTMPDSMDGPTLHFLLLSSSHKALRGVGYEVTWMMWCMCDLCMDMTNLYYYCFCPTYTQIYIAIWPLISKWLGRARFCLKFLTIKISFSSPHCIVCQRGAVLLWPKLWSPTSLSWQSWM